MTRAVSQEELAGLLGVTPRWIRDLDRRGLPSSGSGKAKRYPLPEAIRWYTEHRVEAATDRQGAGLQAAMTRRQIAAARTAEMQLAQLEATLIPRGVHAKVLDQVCSELQDRLTAVPRRYAPELVGIDDPRIMMGELRRVSSAILDELRRDPWRSVGGGELEAGGEGEAA